MYKWIHTVQTHVVEGSTLVSFTSAQARNRNRKCERTGRVVVTERVRTLIQGTHGEA